MRIIKNRVLYELLINRVDTNNVLLHVLVQLCTLQCTDNEYSEHSTHTTNLTFSEVSKTKHCCVQNYIFFSVVADR